MCIERADSPYTSPRGRKNTEYIYSDEGFCMRKTDKDDTQSSGNVLKNLGLPSPEARLTKAKLAYQINRLISTQGMTQKVAANCLGISSYKMTNLRNGRLNGFTTDRLRSLLEELE